MSQLFAVIVSLLIQTTLSDDIYGPLTLQIKWNGGGSDKVFILNYDNLCFASEDEELNDIYMLINISSVIKVTKLDCCAVDFGSSDDSWGYTVDPVPFEESGSISYRVLLCKTQEICENSNRISAKADDTNCSPIVDPTYFEDGLYIEQSLLFGVGYGFLMVILIRIIHYGYFLYRRYKFGKIMSAEIIDRDANRMKHKGNINSTSTYYVKYEYYITCDYEIYTNRLIYNFCRTGIYIPDGVIQIIIIYLGKETIYFQYGPFNNREQVGRSVYESEKVKIRYDPNYPKSCKHVRHDESIFTTVGCYGIFALIVMAGFMYAMYFFFDALYQIVSYNDHTAEFFAIFISCMICFITFIVIWDYYKYGMGCFRERILGPLHCIIQNQFV